MKKKIGFEQLIELNEGQKEQLVKWWNTKNNNTEVPLLTIGDMLELLLDYNYAGSSFSLNIDQEKGLSTINTDFVDNHMFAYQAQELCDALWEAVKQVINQEAMK